MSYLAQEVNKLEKVNGALTNEANLLRRENKDLKLKVYELGEETEQSLSRVQD